MKLSAKIIRKEDIVSAAQIREFVIRSLEAQNISSGSGDDFAQDAVDAPEDVQGKDEVSLAYEKGLCEGQDLARQQVEAEYKQAFGVLNSLCTAMEQEKQAMLRAAEESLVKLSLAIARKVVDSDTQTNPDIIKNVAKQAIQQLIDKDELVIRVNSQDLQVLDAADPDMAVLLGGSGKAKIVADDFVSRGGCIIESKSGVVDSDIKTRMEEMERQIIQQQAGDEH